MASPDQERMDAISGALARLLERQSNLDARLVRIEAAVGFPPLTKDKRHEAGKALGCSVRRR